MWYTGSVRSWGCRDLPTFSSFFITFFLTSRKAVPFLSLFHGTAFLLAEVVKSAKRDIIITSGKKRKFKIHAKKAGGANLRPFSLG